MEQGVLPELHSNNGIQNNHSIILNEDVLDVIVKFLYRILIDTDIEDMEFNT